MATPDSPSPSPAATTVGPDLVRRELADSAGTWVVKVGTGVLTGSDGSLDLERLGHLAEELSAVADTGRRVALVSSGAVGAGVGLLKLPGRPTDLPTIQAAAAVGQSYLIRAYDESFRRQGRHAAQLLLTHEDFDDRPRYLNMRRTLSALFKLGAIPIINENDTISVEEIQFGDNDRLAAMVANLLQAPLLVILSVVDGLSRTDPSTIDGRPPEWLDVVADLDEATLGLASDSKSTLGTGGMRSKLEAVRLAVRAGGSAVIASGKSDRPLSRILAGERVGTLFLGKGRTQAARKRWIGLTARPRGVLDVDEGARLALESGMTSLLPIGVVAVTGDFGRGDVVAIRGPSGREFARGLSNYRADDARAILGRRTEEVRSLPNGTHDEVVHRDNLVLTR